MSANNCLCELITVNDLIHNNQLAQTVIRNEWVFGNDCLGEWMAGNECTHSQPSILPDSHSQTPIHSESLFVLIDYCELSHSQ